MEGFGAATRDWFESAFEAPTEVQRRGWRAIASGEHSLLIAPTGSGKTLAAFLWSVDRLAHARPELAERRTRAPQHTSVVYVSPLKALVYDLERNLRAPLVGIERAARRLDLDVTVPRVAVRTGDTTARERREQLRSPGDILVTTPESLYLILGSRARALPAHRRDRRRFGSDLAVRRDIARGRLSRRLSRPRAGVALMPEDVAELADLLSAVRLVVPTTQTQ